MLLKDLKSLLMKLKLAKLWTLIVSKKYLMFIFLRYLTRWALPVKTLMECVLMNYLIKNLKKKLQQQKMLLNYSVPELLVISQLAETALKIMNSELLIGQIGWLFTQVKKFIYEETLKITKRLGHLELTMRNF